MNSLYYYNEEADYFRLIELNEKLFFISCKKCHNIPEILLKDNENLLIECINCNIKKEEKVSNICNYSSEWMTNVIISFCELPHDEKIVSSFFCKTCNLFLCQECSKFHNQNNNHENITLDDFKINICDYHNIKPPFYCKDCDIEFCEKCKIIHNNHKFLKIDNIKFNEINGGLTNLKMFESFLKNTMKVQKEEYNYVNEILIIIEGSNDEDKELLNNTESNILRIFYKNIKTELNLIFLAKILFFTYKISKKNLENTLKYKAILSAINRIFTNEEIEKFKNSIISLKKKYEILTQKLSQDETKNLEININDIFKPCDTKLSEFESNKKFIEDNIISSSILKKYITIEKEKNPDNYVNIDETLNDLDNIYDNLNSIGKDEFILSLLGKCIEKNGTEISISRKKDEKFKDIELASIQTLFSLGNQKKFELHFDFGNENNKKILNEKEEKEKFIKKWKPILAEKLKIHEEQLILSDVHSGSLAVHAAIINSTEENEKAMKELKIAEIKKIEEKPMLEALQISPEILDKKGNRYKGWGVNEKRGGEKYIPPINGWYGIGLKVMNKYDNGNNDWLGYRNKKGEYAVGYIGINNSYNDKEKMIEDISSLSQSMNSINNKMYIQEENIRYNMRKKIMGGIGFALSLPLFILSPPAGLALATSSLNFGFRGDKCGDGVCVFQNPDYAENNAGYIDLFGYRIKIMLMCRVNPTKIRQPKSFPECWILDPKEIRPYRILIKKLPISPLTGALNEAIITSISPINYIIDAIKSKDFSFVNIANEERFSNISLINGQKTKDDYFVIRLYSSVYFGFINEYLRTQKVLDNFRNHKGFTEDQLKSWICCLQIALSRNKNVKDGSIVYRRVKKNKFPSDIGIGSKFYFREFLSTSTYKKFSENWIKKNNDSKEGTLMIITIKNNGTNGFPNYCYYIEDITYTKNQYEVLISSHCCFTVTNIEHKEKIDYVSLICEGYLFE